MRVNEEDDMRLDQNVSDRIRNCLVDLIHPSKIIIFGSYARGQATDDSDIDIAVIAGDGQPSDRDALVRSRVALRRALKGTNLAIDFILQSKEKFDKERRNAGSIQQTIDTEGMVIYEQQR